MTIIIIGIASNLDNAGAGIAYGVRKIRIPWFSNLIIALTGFLMTLVAGFFGNWISIWLTPFAGNLIGMIILVTIGIRVIYQPFNEKKVPPQSDGSSLIRVLRNPEEADLDGSKTIGFVESVILAIALSINCLAGGFDAGITHLNIWITSIITGIFSYLCVGLFAYLGLRFCAEKFGKQATIVSGVLLILVGLHQMIN
jgi:putative sporulation protein YtaF